MRRTFCISIFGLVAAHSWAWGDLGHQVTAAVAWQNLDRATKVEVAKILMHGDTATGTRNNEPFAHVMSVQPVTEDKLTDTFLEKYVAPVFILSSVWADDIKRGKSTHFDGFIDELNNKFKMTHVGESEQTRCKSWHYLDLPLVRDASGKVIESSPETHPYAMSNAENAMVQFIKPGLSRMPVDAGDGPDKRSVFLYFAVHIVGDLHQPLHCVSLFGPEFPEGGDAGGNLFKLDEGNLHSLWDRGVDTAVRNEGIERDANNTQVAIKVAAKWIADGPTPLPAKIGKQNPLTWVIEGRDAAAESAYTDIAMGQKPSETYMSRLAQLCKKNVVLAGYRLAQFLKDQLK